jgi:hypothetical protein
MTLMQRRPGAGFPRSKGAPRLSGSIFDEPDPAAELLDAVHLFRNNQATVAQLATALRGTDVYVAVSDEDDGFALSIGRNGELSWLAVFTSLDRMAEFYRAAGRGADSVRYGMLSGAELIDECLPDLPRGTGLVLDPGTEHGTALAPVAGLVPDEIALTEGGK